MWLLRCVALALYPRGAVRRVLRGPAKGMRFYVADGMGVSYAIGRDSSPPSWFSRHVRRGMTVYDVGANRGQMTLIFANLVGPEGSVVALEPAPLEYSRLVKNVRLNRLDQVRSVHAAAGDRPGDVTFVYEPGRPTVGRLSTVVTSRSLTTAEHVTVPAVRLDDLAGRPPDFVKIDVEGAAAGVLKGMRELVARAHPRVYVELHGPEEQAAVRDELLSSGYVAETLDGRHIADPTVGWNSPLFCYRR